MHTIDAPREPNPAPALAEAQPWRHISPSYAWVLRFGLLVNAAFLTILPWIGVFSAGIQPQAWMGASSVALLLFYLILMLVWVPRRVRLTQYLLRPLDVHMRTGYWWRNTTSVAINRIQHLEITQGPVERALGLSTLVLYTAGGFQSDLKLPGLDTEVARQLKAELLHQVTQEEVASDTGQ